MDYKIFWTEEALQNLDEIIEYLSSKWTEKEVNDFKTKLYSQIDHINKNPKMFPSSLMQPRLRKAVLSKKTSIYYELKNNYIYLAYIFVSYKDPDILR